MEEALTPAGRISNRGRDAVLWGASMGKFEMEYEKHNT